MATEIRTGDEVRRLFTNDRGVVVEGWVRESGKHKGKISVMFIGARYTEAVDPDTLEVLE